MLRTSYGLLVCLLWTTLASAASTTSQPSAQYAHLPLAFERRLENRSESFVARGAGYSIGLRNGAATLETTSANGTAQDRVSIEFVDGAPAQGVAGPELPGKINYIHGNDPRQWRLGVPTYQHVTYGEIYPGIDLVYYGNQQQLEFDFLVRPGADPSRIRMRLRGASKVALDAAGTLTAGTSFRLPLPAIYQEAAGGRHAIAGHYELLEGAEVAFRVDGYDHSRPLVIDPTFVYSGTLGGGSSDTTGFGIAVDPQGNAYITGATSVADFPTLNAAYPLSRGGGDGFVTKINPAGTAIIYSTYIGGSSADIMQGISADLNGNAYVTGYTTSADFPLAAAAQSAYNGGNTAVVLKLSPTGGLIYSTYLGSNDMGHGIAADQNGNAYVTGVVAATGGTFPVTGGAASTVHAKDDAFAAKFGPAGTLLYATYVGGSDSDAGWGIAVDATGSAYVTGSTLSTSFTGAPGGGAQSINRGGQDAFIAKVNAAGNGFAYLTFLGGSSSETGYGVAVDANGNAYVTGITNSTDFASTGNLLPANVRGVQNGFVTKVNATGSTFVYSTIVGANRSDTFRGIAVDAAGDAIVAGFTDSDKFPMVSAIQPTLAGNGTSLFFSSTSGQAWTSIDANIPGAVVSVSPDPVSSSVLVASTDGGTYRTINFGATWAGVSPTTSLALFRSPASANTIYGINCGSTSVSTDGGVSFRAAGAISGCPNVVLPDPLTGNTAYAYDPTTAAGGPYKTIDGGSTWNLSRTGLPPNGFLYSIVGASNGNLYADMPGIGVYRSTDHGATWTFLALAGSDATVGGLAVAPSNPLILYKSVNTTTPVKSVDGGATWQPVTGSLPVTALSITVSPVNPQVVGVGVASPPTFYLSTDGGVTWAPASVGLGIASPTQFLFAPGSSTGFYAVAPVNSGAFVAKLNPAGNGLMFSSFLGGAYGSTANAVAATATGDSLVTGGTLGPFPASGPPFTATPFNNSAIAVRITDTTSPCTFTVSPGSQVVPATLSGPIYSVLAPSGCTWTASSNQSWANIVNGTLGSGSGYVYIVASANTTGVTRSATISVAGQVATITQAPTSCSYSLNPPNALVDPSGGPVQVTLTTGTGCPWSITNYDPSAVTVVSSASGTGSSTISLSVAPSGSTTSHGYSLQIGPVIFPINQAGSCLFLSSTSASATAAGGPGSVNVNTIGTCAWTAISNNTSFLTITSGAAGTSSGTVGYTVAANTGAARAGTLTIGGVTFTVNQAAGTIGTGLPSIGAPNPPSGSGLGPTTYTFTFNDPRGAATLDVVNVLINNFLDGRHACYLAYSVPSNSLFLVDDAGDAGGPFAGSLALGSAAKIQNSQCTVGLTSAVANGNTLTLVLSIGFTASFGGNRIVYQAARDLAAQNSDWQALGIWQVPFTPAGTISVGIPNPTRGSATNGTAQTYTIPIIDTKGTGDIGVVNLLVNNFIDGRHACYLAYVNSTNTLLLIDDAGDVAGPYAGQMVLNGTGTIQNSQCLVNAAGSSAASSGNTLTLTLNITFKTGAIGNRIFFIAGRDKSDGNNTDWNAMATWSVQ